MENFLDRLYLSLTKLYLAKGRHRTVVITGSVGKTSVTQAVATVLRQDFNVLTTKLNYNTHRGVPLTVFDLHIPTKRIGWLGVTARAATKAIFARPSFTMLVLELGTDKPGDIAKFSFLKPDLAVITATTPEHMEFFKTLDAVAREEMSTAQFSKKILVNTELVLPELIAKYSGNTPIVRYGAGTKNTITDGDNGMVKITNEDDLIESADFHLVGAAGYSTLLAANTVATIIGMTKEKRLAGLKEIYPVAGRMNKLRGKNGSIIIDDTYNSSPEAVKSALDYIYSQGATKKIALLGMMNEMGDESERLHREVGGWCDPNLLSLVVTLGKDANAFLAEEAERAGCKVVRTETPYEAGEVIEKELEAGTIVLAKGSQNGVYAEEAVRMWLDDPNDAEKLVRQHTYWPAKKAKQFVHK